MQKILHPYILLPASFPLQVIYLGDISEGQNKVQTMAKAQKALNGAE